METAKGKTREEIITRLADRIDSYERYSQPHSRLMAELGVLLARRFGLEQADVNAVAEAALLHDIGLYAMNPAYYTSPGPLSFEERMDLWRHAIVGEQQMAKREATRHAQLLVRWHHEWWDGSGYPDMLAFEDIPIGARILRAVELYSALTSDRPYRAALAPNRAVEALKGSAGIECDPYVIKALIALLDELGAQAIEVEPETAVEAPASNQNMLGLRPFHLPPAAPQTEPLPAGSEPPAYGESRPEIVRDSSADAVNLRELAGDENLAPKQQADTIAPERPALMMLLKSRDRSKAYAGDQARGWRAWRGSRYNNKSMLGFEASVLRQIEFRSIAIPLCGWARLDWYLKAWGKLIFSNDPRSWAMAAARAMVEAKEPLGEDRIAHLLEDVYVPGIKLGNPNLRRWFGESDAWWLDNLRRNVAAMDDELMQAQALILGLQTGDYALSFEEETRDLRQPLTTIFWRLAGRASIGSPGHPHNRSYHQPLEEFIKQTRVDLLYLRLPSVHTEQAGAAARYEWRESWVGGQDAPARDDLLTAITASQSKQSYLAQVDRLLRAAQHIKTWTIGCQEIGLASAHDISELIKEHRPVRTTYSKDLTEVAGGLRSYIIVAERA